MNVMAVTQQEDRVKAFLFFPLSLRIHLYFHSGLFQSKKHQILVASVPFRLIPEKVLLPYLLPLVALPNGELHLHGK